MLTSRVTDEQTGSESWNDFPETTEPGNSGDQAWIQRTWISRSGRGTGVPQVQSMTVAFRDPASTHRAFFLRLAAAQTALRARSGAFALLPLVLL